MSIKHSSKMLHFVSMERKEGTERKTNNTWLLREEKICKGERGKREGERERERERGRGEEKGEEGWVRIWKRTQAPASVDSAFPFSSRLQTASVHVRAHLGGDLVY